MTAENPHNQADEGDDRNRTGGAFRSSERLFYLWGCAQCQWRSWSISAPASDDQPVGTYRIQQHCHDGLTRSPIMLIAVCREAGQHVEWRAP